MPTPRVTIGAPAVGDLIAAMRRVPVAYHGRTMTVGEWVDYCKQCVHQWRAEAGELEIFQRFLAALLERQMSGETYEPRVEHFRERLAHPGKLTIRSAERMLRNLGYRFWPQGARTMVEFRDRWAELGWSWREYFAVAEGHWATGFLEDPLLGVKGIGLKTRDFALSEFSDYFCAFDVHISRLIARTGLLLHGYGDPGLGDLSYHFLRRLVVRFCREDGFPERPEALTPADFDRTLWFFGQGFCGATAPCADCTVASVCLTGRRR